VNEGVRWHQQCTEVTKRCKYPCEGRGVCSVWECPTTTMSLHHWPEWPATRSPNGRVTVGEWPGNAWEGIGNVNASTTTTAVFILGRGKRTRERTRNEITRERNKRQIKCEITNEVRGQMNDVRGEQMKCREAVRDQTTTTTASATQYRNIE